MNYDEARRAAIERSQALSGRESNADAPAELYVDDCETEEMIRRLLLGAVEPEDLDDLIRGTENAARNAISLLMLAPTPASMIASLQFLLAQQFLLGALMGRGS